jgi:hypothetical protein
MGFQDPSTSDPGFMPEPKYDNFFTPENRNFYSKFTYADLDPAKREIRLLRVHPSCTTFEDNKVRCDLIDQVELADVEGKYTTISYCAGDPKQTSSVIINGHEFNAFDNLAHALKRARHFWETNHVKKGFLLWADQICINQSNSSERSHQVGLMRDIYASAEQVIICLSTENDSDRGISFLHRLGRESPGFLARSGLEPRKEAQAQVIEPADQESKEMSLSDGSISRLDADVLKKYLIENWDNVEYHREWHLMEGTFLRSAWWGRAWVRQELIASPRAYFLFGDESISWPALATIMVPYLKATRDAGGIDGWSNIRWKDTDPVHSCHIHRGRRALSMVAHGRASCMVNAKVESLQNACPIDLVSNLTEAHHYEASDPRDLIYAFLSLSDPAYGIIPDYSPQNTIDDVLIDTAQKIIIFDGSLDVLAYAQPTRTIGSDLPSWVADWRYPIDSRWPSYRPTLDTPLTKGTGADVSFHADANGREGRVLRTRGFLADRLMYSHFKCGPALTFRTARGHDVCTTVLAEEGDEIWMLYGAKNFFVLRHQGVHHKLICERMSETGDYCDPFKEAANLLKSHEAELKLIDIH